MLNTWVLHASFCVKPFVQRNVSEWWPRRSPDWPEFSVNTVWKLESRADKLTEMPLRCLFGSKIRILLGCGLGKPDFVSEKRVQSVNHNCRLCKSLIRLLWMQLFANSDQHNAEYFFRI
jgi:hypothetical protein